jgi:Ni/Co efflux regulator RcnB
MKRLMIAAVAVAFTAGGVALPAAASANAAHAAAHHASHSIKQKPCKGWGVDLALGPKNICVPL